MGEKGNLSLTGEQINTILNNIKNNKYLEKIKLDKTLSLSGAPADSAIIGQKIVDLNKYVALPYEQKTYKLNDFCTYEGNLYICTTEITSAESWNDDHWTLTNFKTNLSVTRQTLELISNIIKVQGITPEELEFIASNGLANIFFDIGDEIMLKWIDYYPSTPVEYDFPMRIVDIDVAYEPKVKSFKSSLDDPDDDPDTDIVHPNAIWLQAVYAPLGLRYSGDPPVYTRSGFTFDSSERVYASGIFKDDRYYYKNIDGSFIQQEVIIGDSIPQDTYYEHIYSDAGVLISSGYGRYSHSTLRQWLNWDAIGDWVFHNI